MKLFLTGFLLLFSNWFPQQSINLETCQNVLVYSAPTDNRLRYYQLDVSQQSEIELPFNNLVSAPTWSPDGDYIAIATYNDHTGFDLAILSDISDEPVQIASGQATQPKIRWSPNSDWIAFESQNNIHVVMRTGDEYRQLTQGNQVYYLGDWSPDGQYLAISAYDIEGQHLIVANLETGSLREISPLTQGIFDYFVGWTPDSAGILYSTNRFSDEMSLYRFDLHDETSETYIASLVRSISWNPSGTQFVYALSNSGFIEIHIRNLLTGGDVLLTQGSTLLHENFAEPMWSPSGLFVAFSAIDDSNRGNPYEIFALNLETDEITQLTSNTRNDDNPYWIPCQS